MLHYYHGTSPSAALRISGQGFQLGKLTNGRFLGRGLYITANRLFAARWGPVVYKCQLAAGTRILRRSKADPKTVAYLRREFGASITSERFWTALPRNKQFTRHEIINIWHLLLERLASTKGRPLNFSRVFEQLRKHGFDGVEDCNPDWPETLLFNPSAVQPLDAVLVKSWSYDLRDSSGFAFDGPLTPSDLRRIDSDLRSQQLKQDVQEASAARLDHLYHQFLEASLAHLRSYRDGQEPPGCPQDMQRALVAFWVRDLSRNPHFNAVFRDLDGMDVFAAWVVRICNRQELGS